MSYALSSFDLKKVDGAFVEKEHKKHFEFSRCLLTDWDKSHGMTHRIFVGPCGEETRPAIIKKTVAYVCVDEDENGQPVMEKWLIRTEWNRN